MFGPGWSRDDADLIAAKEACFGVLAARVAAESTADQDREARAVGCWALVHGLAILFLDDRIAHEITGCDDEITRRVAAAMLR